MEQKLSMNPHDYHIGKTEAIIVSLVNTSTRKVDLVHQKIGTPGDFPDDMESFYILREWFRGADTFRLNEIELTADQLKQLRRAALMEEVRAGKNPTLSTKSWSLADATETVEDEDEVVDLGDPEEFEESEEPEDNGNAPSDTPDTAAAEDAPTTAAQEEIPDAPQDKG